mmetsp:Transcript_1108/g.1512  ORF Transcript_1108/g.1512 Transcript_1108/m.1512 type:complete len:257 (-) Transcript_1108:38-808(-)
MCMITIRDKSDTISFHRDIIIKRNLRDYPGTTSTKNRLYSCDSVDSSSSSSTTTSSTSSSISSLTDRSVKFDKVIIREYDVTVGDNPSCSGGVPISLSYEYNPHHKEISIDQYEDARIGQRCNASGMRINMHVRQHRLMSIWGVPFSEIRKAEIECEKSKSKRLESQQFYLEDHMKNEKQIMSNNCNNEYTKDCSKDTTNDSIYDRCLQKSFRNVSRALFTLRSSHRRTPIMKKWANKNRNFRKHKGYKMMNGILA